MTKKATMHGENLSKDELQNRNRGGTKRIPSFLTSLEELTITGKRAGFSSGQLAHFRKSVNSLCKAEIAYMRKELSNNDGEFSVQTLHRYISDYRNAVRDVYTGVEMPEIYNDKWGRKQRTHIAIKYLNMTKKEKGARVALDMNAKDKYTSLDDGGRLIIDSHERLIHTALELLKSKKWDELAIGIMAVTGRRPIEILSSGALTATGKNTCNFKGQAKKIDSAEHEQGYKIYTLAPSQIVVDALARLRKLKPLNNLNNRQIESRTSGRLGVTVREHLNDVLEKPDLITPKSLRGIWVNVAHNLFKPMSIDTVFATQMLGHSANSGAKSSSAAENYMQFYCYPLLKQEINKILAIID